MAVDDIKAVQEQAALKRMAMQVNRKNRFYLIDFCLTSCINVVLSNKTRSCRGCMVVGFTTTCAVGAYHH